MSNKIQISQNCYYLEDDLIGQGSYGVVYKGIYKQKNNFEIEVAIKKLKKTVNNRMNDYYERELKTSQLMQQVAGKNINFVQIYDIIQDQEQNHSYIIMEYCENDTLLKLILNFSKIQWQTALDYISQIANALIVLHDYNIAHRDIKLENIFVKYDNQSNKYIMKLGDFGLTSTDEMKASKVGTITYMAPDMLQLEPEKQYYTHKVDIWAVGCILHELITGFKLFEGNNPNMVRINIINFEGYKSFWSKNFNLQELVPEKVADLLDLKFEAKSKRVKGLAFHPIRPWVLSALHTGEIQLWDYRLKQLLDVFEDHEGPVRGIDFHLTQPLFTSGGDDYKIRVWNYKQKKCLFVMKGHLDYIRTVQFHHELPWILSASDDQTIRIWNWQNRNMIAILTGHSHYVMCAQFHPSKDLIVSCSLDQTLRIWDFTAIRKKFMQSSTNKTSTQMHSGNEVDIHSVLEGHERGINWCCFHPTLNLIASAGDDKKVKIWKYTETKAWEHDSLYGHNNNVSSVTFHPKLDIIISNSEDKTTKVWDLNKRLPMDSFKRDNDRFWVLSVHPENLTFASGCDSGFFVFSLFKEGIPVALTDNENLFYSYRRQIKYFNLNQKVENIVKTFESSSSGTMLSDNIIFLQYNNYETQFIQFIVGIDQKEKVINKYVLLSYDTNKFDDIKNSKETQKTFYAKGATFVSKNKIARIRESSDIEIYNVDLDSTSNALPDLKDVKKIFQGPIGKIIVVSDEYIILYDTTTKKEVTKFPYNPEFAKVKQVIWNKQSTFVAFVCKKNIYIRNKQLEKVCEIKEKFNIKSLTWHNNIFFYTTINHLKFGLLNGETGIIKCIDSNLTVVKVEDNNLISIDRQSKILKTSINCEELQLKKALFDKNWEKIKYYMEHNQKLGNSVVSYLYKKNYSALALNLVDDIKAKFSLAVDSGNLEQAFKSAKELKDPECWAKLAEEAKRQGNHQIVEVAYQNIKEFEKLSFLYLITGKQEKLQKMLDISIKRGDIMSRFNNALYLGDIQQRIRVLADSNQLQLAYYTAVVHNLPELAQPLKASLDQLEHVDQLKNYKTNAIIPPKPLVLNPETSAQCSRNWPQNVITEEYMVILAEPENGDEQQANIQEAAKAQNNNIVNEEELQEEALKNQDDQKKLNFDNDDDQDVGNWAQDDDLDIPEIENDKKENEGVQNFVPVQEVQVNKLLKSVKQSQIPVDHVFFGLFENAFQLWKKQLGIYNFAPLLNESLKVATSSFTLFQSIPFLQPSQHHLHQNNKPFICKNMNSLQNLLVIGSKYTTDGKFSEAFNAFLDVMYTIPLVKITSEQELKDIKQLITICYEYLMAMKCELFKNTSPDRKFELTAYMAICNLKPNHRILTLRVAMNQAYKLQNYVYSSYFAKKLIRLLETNPNLAKPDVIQGAQKLLRACEQNGTNANQIVFDESWLYEDDAAYNIDPLTMKLLQNPRESVKCPYCGARHNKNSVDSICKLCNLGKVGIQVIGLKV